MSKMSGVYEKYGRNFLRGLLTGCGLWLFGLLIFSITLPRVISLQDQENLACDGVVVFTGGKRRLPFAYELFKKTKAPFFLISGVDRGVSFDDLFPRDKMSRTQDHRITLGMNAKDTRTNALETFEWAGKNHIKNLCVVTHQYHMRRSLLELRQFFEEESLIALPLSQKEPFWKNVDSLLFLVSEYQKFCLVYVMQIVKSLRKEKNDQSK